MERMYIQYNSLICSLTNINSCVPCWVHSRMQRRFLVLYTGYCPFVHPTSSFSCSYRPVLLPALPCSVPQEADSCVIWAPCFLASTGFWLMGGTNRPLKGKSREVWCCFLPAPFLRASFLTVGVCFHNYSFCWGAHTPTFPTLFGFLPLPLQP